MKTLSRIVFCLGLAMLGMSSLRAQVTWGPPTALNTNAAVDSQGDQAPQLTTNGRGVWVAVWHSGEPNIGGQNLGTDYDILFARSTNDGLTWSTPAKLNTNAATDSGDDLFPQLTTDRQGTWIAVWQSDDPDVEIGGQDIGSDTDILYARSTDNGLTWSAPAVLNTNAADGDDHDYAPQLTTDGKGLWIAVWHSAENDIGGQDIGGDHDIIYARSTDDGLTWSAPVALNTSAVEDSGDDQYPQLATNGEGVWIAVWQSIEESIAGQNIGTDWDVLYARSTDDGLTWTAPAMLNTNARTDGGDDFLPYLTTDGRGTWIAVWQSEEHNIGGQNIGTDSDILHTRSTDDGLTWSVPTALNSTAATDEDLDENPRLTTDDRGTWIAVWDCKNIDLGTDSDILFSYSSDNGLTWRDQAALNTNADTDTGDDCRPQLTTDGYGVWIAVWDSNEPNIGAGIGGDFDILFAGMEVDRVACGSVFEIAADAVGLERFHRRPKVYASYFDPVKDPDRLKKAKRATVKVLTRIVKGAGNATIECEWTRRIRLYDVRAFKASEKAGDGAAIWITKENQHDLTMNLHVVTREAATPNQVVQPLALAVPLITLIEPGDPDPRTGNPTLIITGQWFGTRRPKVWREYEVPGKVEGTVVVKRQAMKVVKPTEADADAGFKDSKEKPAHMNCETGASKVIVVVPADPKTGTRNGDIVLDNGVGLATDVDPTWPPK